MCVRVRACVCVDRNGIYKCFNGHIAVAFSLLLLLLVFLCFCFVCSFFADFVVDCFVFCLGRGGGVCFVYLFVFVFF